MNTIIIKAKKKSECNIYFSKNQNFFFLTIKNILPSKENHQISQEKLHKPEYLVILIELKNH